MLHTQFNYFCFWSGYFTDRENVYSILYEEVDESEVEILNIVSATNDEKGVDEYRYPRAGQYS